jgi:hypothetical protein
MSLHVSDQKILRHSDKYQDPGYFEAHKTIERPDDNRDEDAKSPVKSTMTTDFKNVVSSKIDSRRAPTAFVPCYEVNYNNFRPSKFTLVPF